MMNEVKKPKKPLIFYYVAVMFVMSLFNLIFMPWFLQRQVKEVDYGTFITMTENKEVIQEIEQRVHEVLNQRIEHEIERLFSKEGQT